VSGARHRYGVRPPATVGVSEDFDRYLRVQANTIEGLILFLPALWLSALLVRTRARACRSALTPTPGEQRRLRLRRPSVRRRSRDVRPRILRGRRKALSWLWHHHTVRPLQPGSLCTCADAFPASQCARPPPRAEQHWRGALVPCPLRALCHTFRWETSGAGDHFDRASLMERGGRKPNVSERSMILETPIDGSWELTPLCTDARLSASCSRWRRRWRSPCRCTSSRLTGACGCAARRLAGAR